MKKIIVVLILLSLPLQLIAWVDPNADSMQEGNQLYQEKKYQQAGKIYNKLSHKKNRKRQQAIAHFNNGNALYQQGKYKEAASEYFKAAQHPDKKLREKALNNMGISYAKQGDKKNALKSFLSALNENPQNNEIRKNIERLYQKQEEKQQKKDQKNKKQKSEQQQNQQAQQKQAQQQQQDDKITESEAKEQQKTNSADKKLAEKLIQEASRNRVKRRKPQTQNNSGLPY